jgi:hypothetical protein
MGVMKRPRRKGVHLRARRVRGAKGARRQDCACDRLQGVRTEALFVAAGSDDLIDSMACGDDVEHGKPDPRLVGLALRKLGVPAGRVVMIGDTPYDAEARKRSRHRRRRRAHRRVRQTSARGGGELRSCTRAPVGQVRHARARTPPCTTSG